MTLHDVDAALAVRGLSMRDLRERFRGAVPHEAVLLVGSIAEGMSNRSSDLDVLIIGGHGPSGGIAFEAGPYSVICEPLASGVLADATVLPVDFVDELGRRFERAALVVSPDGVLAARGAHQIFTMEERKLLHRLQTGIVIDGEGYVEAWRERARISMLADFIFHFALNVHYSRREDARAQLDQDEPWTALLMLQESAGFLVDAVLAGLGDTNANTKWRAKRLMHCTGIADELRQELISLMLPAAADEPCAVLERVVSACDAALVSVLRVRPELAISGERLVSRLGWSRFSC